MTVKSLLVTIGIDTSEFEQGMAKAKNATDDFKKVGMTMTAVGGVMEAFFGLCVKDAISAEAAQDKLRAQLDRIPGSAQGGADALVAYADKMQGLTGIENDEIIAAESMLATFGLNAQQIMVLIPRVLDMAAAHAKATGETLDLTSTARDLGRAVTTNVTSLQRHGVVLGEDTKATGDLNLIMRDLDKQFGGSAVAVGQTFAGQMKIAELSIKDVMKSIGSDLIPVLLPLVQDIGNAAKKAGEWAASHQDVMKSLIPLVAATGGLLAVLGPLVIVVGNVINSKIKWGQAIVNILLNPIGMLIAGVAAFVIIAEKMFATNQRLIEQSKITFDGQSQLIDNLAMAAARCHITGSAWEDLTKKYHDNWVEMAEAVLNGDEGIAMQKALNSEMTAARKVTQDKIDADAKAKKAQDDLMNSGLNLNLNNKKSIDLQKELITIRDALTEEIKKATSTEMATEATGAQNEYAERLRLLGKTGLPKKATLLNSRRSPSRP